MIVGVDTGGTFTDFVAMDTEGRLSILKVASTSLDPSEAIAEGLRRLPPTDDLWLIHGTTVATNALLERKGAKTALLTTQGCRDVLEIARQTRTELYSLAPSPRIPLIPRERRYEVDERLDWQGRVVATLDIEAVERALEAMQAGDVESVAICFLFSFLNPDHEQEAGRRARLRGLKVSLSSEIAPEFREYERTSTTSANAFVAPSMERYLNNLQSRLGLTDNTRQVEGNVSRLSIMQSNGGTLRAGEAAKAAVKTVLSGPAGGLIAAVQTAKASGISRLMTFDMGGTSTDVALMDGAPETMRTGEVAGIPLLTPMLDIHTVGAGGGSLARLDAGGGLRVGPQSAGADPGPVAYGRGDQLTVTDANLLLGRLPAELRLAGRVPLDDARVRACFAAFAAQTGLRPEQAAEGILSVVNAQMSRALRHISTERGRDPRDYTLVSFGGAGGLHACALAEALNMPRILVPRYPGAFSALGLVLADIRREYARSFFRPAADAFNREVLAEVESLSLEANRQMEEEGVSTKDRVLAAFVEAQYVGQSYALRVPFRSRLSDAARQFHRAHRARYGHADPDQPVEIVLVGLAALGLQERSLHIAPRASSAPALPVQTAPIWLNGQMQQAPLYERSTLAFEQEIFGPAIIVQEDATTWLEPGWRATVDRQANLKLERVE